MGKIGRRGQDFAEVQDFTQHRSSSGVCAIFSTQQAGLLTPFVKKQRSGDPGTKTGSGKEFWRPRVGGHCPRAFSSIQAAFSASASRCCF